MAQIAYVDWDGLVYYDGKIKDYISNNLEDTLKDGGQVLYDQLPTPTRNNVNFVFTVMEDFTRTEELFGVNGGTYNKGTAVKVTEVNPGQYLYTIVNETRNPSDVEAFDDIYEQIKELKNAIDAFNPESSDYYNKSEINERFARTHLELDRQDKRIDKLAEDQSEDHRVLCELISGGVDIDLNNYYTKEESDSKFTTFEDLVAKADNILFTDKKYEVTNSIGKFVSGDIISNISITELFSKILGLEEYIEPVIPDDPDNDIITDIITNNKSMYQINENSEWIEIPFDFVSFDNTDYTAMNSKDCFYQYETEYGYQHISSENDSMFYVIALPETLDFNSNIITKVWDKGNKIWQDTNLDMSNDMEFITQVFEESELTLPEVRTGYQLWIDSSLNTCDGADYRFIIK